MKFGQNLIAAAAGALLLGGCASMQSGTTQEIQVNSNPSGATVLIGNLAKDGTPINMVAAGVTPLKVRISRKSGAITVEKAGYTGVNIPMTTKMNPWVWGDIALGSPLSTSIDTSTGAANEYDPGEYTIDLKPLGK